MSGCPYQRKNFVKPWLFNRCWDAEYKHREMENIEDSPTKIPILQFFTSKYHGTRKID
jgi:hypothetical protein